MLKIAAVSFKDLDDLTLAGHVAAGETQALEVLMRRHNRTLYRAARSILKDDAEAEDVVQDTYLLACRTIAGFRGQSKLSTWLTRIAINEALGRVRKQKRRAEIIPLEDGTAPDFESAEEQAMPQHAPQSPEAATLRAEVRRLIERRIDDLPDAFRSVFVMRALEDMTVEETADCLGLPPATVRTRFFRARSLLREALAREIDINFESAFGFDGARCDRIVARVLERLQASTTRGDGAAQS